MNAVNKEHIPQELKDRDVWVVWKPRQQANGKLRKIPVTAEGKYREGKAIYDDLLPFEDAVTCARSLGEPYGIGFVFTQGCGLVGIDLDACLTDAGVLRPWASDLLQRIQGTYTEISPSGRGLKAWVTADLSDLNGGRYSRPMDHQDKDQKCELFWANQFFTVTGTVWRECKAGPDGEYGVLDRQYYINELLSKWGVGSNAAESKASPIADLRADCENGTDDFIAVCLKFLDPDMVQPEWTRVLATIKRHCSSRMGDSLAADWSGRGAKWDGERDFGRHYDRAVRADRGMSLKRLLAFVKEQNGGTVPDEVLAKYKSLSPIMQIGEDWAYVEETSTIYEVLDGAVTPHSEKTFNSRYAEYGDHRMTPRNLFARMKAIRHYRTLTYEPRQAWEIEDERGDPALNLWRGSTIKPIPGDVQPFLDHVAYLLPDSAEQKYLLDWMAAVVRGVKVHYALLLWGEAKGVGKSYLGSAVMTPLLGSHNVHTLGAGDLENLRFNSWMAAKQLVVVEEMRTIERRHVMNDLKPHITEPRVRWERKGVDVANIPNRVNFMLFSNHEDCLPLEDGDRRFLVLRTEATRRETEYYSRLFTWTADNRSALLHYLEAGHDLSTFCATAEAPLTKAKRAMAFEGMSAEAQCLSGLIQDQELGIFQRDLVEVSEVTQVLHEHGFNTADNKKTSFYLKDVGAKRLTSAREGGVTVDGRRLTLYAVRNQAAYSSLNNRQLRAKWLVQSGLDISEKQSRLGWQ